MSTWSGTGPMSSRRLSVTGLVLANAVPLIGVIGFGWDLHSLLVLYWLESGVVGAAFYAKITRARGTDDPEALPSFSLNERPVSSFVGSSNRRIARFYLGHYGGFWAVHGLFVFVFAFAFPGMDLARPSVLATAGIGLVAYHALSYRVNFVGEREFEHTGPVTLMIEPYRRVLVLHVTIVMGGFAIGAIGAPVGALVVMVLAKTVLDLWGHWKEHERLGAGGSEDISVGS